MGVVAQSKTNGRNIHSTHCKFNPGPLAANQSCPQSQHDNLIPEGWHWSLSCCLDFTGNTGRINVMPVEHYLFLSSAFLIHLLSPIHVDRTKLPHKINLTSSSRSPTAPLRLTTTPSGWDC